MAEEHANISLLKRLDRRDLTATPELYAPDVVFHYFNPRLPDMQGDYVGLTAMQSFFSKLGALTGGTFQVEPISMVAAGDELVVVQTRNTMTLQGQPIAIDVVVVWRIVQGRISEIWDIPSAHTMASPP